MALTPGVVVQGCRSKQLISRRLDGECAVGRARHAEDQRRPLHKHNHLRLWQGDTTSGLVGSKRSRRPSPSAMKEGHQIAFFYNAAAEIHCWHAAPGSANVLAMEKEPAEDGTSMDFHL